LREYRWPYGVPDDLDRPGKEEWLSGLVRRFGVPAPREVSRIAVGNVVVVLREYLPGRPLGDVPTGRTSAWRAAGTMMARIHAIEIDGDASAGVIVGRSVRPFTEGSWGRWQLANAVKHGGSVSERGTYEVDPERVRRLYSRALPLLDSRPVRLLHNDVHPWNILVDGSGDEWRCTGWLDWEFAWTGDPAWDVARLDIFRLKDIGPTPAAFDDGYGSPRVPVVSELYEFAIMLWMSDQDAAGDTALGPTYRQAHLYLSEADAVLSRLERLISR
jgi:aminoglycoside phosphotransferase (APT) family kinase protein